MKELDAWLAAAGRRAGVDPADIPTRLVLDLARDVAHGVVRPGAPVTAYLLGVAVGRGADPAELAARLSELAVSWSPGEGAEPPIP
ncbi:DUF6457 domain-containing protein [Paractinoplanes hotanensis]|uniref:DUF6457 domain-containing protein n=1 Tax=Paractinoplanes hotanensis TaxID=2906497 RepID=A0ABT0YAA1_9ACTN|nr:DUF6457 domain-containing protein [Actinoplanes hotanensis]MCM4082961.1 DUF6457 domain-containing protein [Actinoplanes hotanensis]